MSKFVWINNNEAVNLDNVLTVRLIKDIGENEYSFNFEMIHGGDTSVTRYKSSLFTTLEDAYTWFDDEIID